MNNETELKPRPFCGNIESLVIVDDETEDLFGVCCFKCEAAIKAVFVKRKEAVDVWNRRISIITWNGRANDDND